MHGPNNNLQYFKDRIFKKLKININFNFSQADEVLFTYLAIPIHYHQL